MSLGVYNGAGSGITKALYHLEDVNDSSGNTHTLTNTNSVGFAAGKFANCADFGTTNANKKLIISDNLDIAGNGNITVSFWTKIRTEPSSGQTFQFFAHISNLTSIRYFQVYYTNDSGTKKLYIDTSAGLVVPLTVNLGTTNWYNIVAVRDISGSEGRLYVNGSLVTTSTLGTYGSLNRNEFVMGDTPSAIFLDEVIVENVVWDAAKVKKAYTFSKGRFGII